MAWISQSTGQNGKLAPWRPLIARAVVSLVLAGGFVWLLADRIAQIDLAALIPAFGQIGPGQWGSALALTALSFWAVGHYDAVVHRHFATGLPPRQARRAGICAIAVSQTLGLGLITGAILRWRMLPGATPWQATRLTAAVALSFLAGWAAVTATTLVILPDAPFKAPALLVSLGFAAAFTVAIAAPRLPWAGFRWPNGITMTRLVALCAVDSLAAAAAFHALCPPELALPFATLLPAFLLALGAGLVLGTPGGMGAFEVTLIALLPTLPETPLLAAILGWRAVYYALPAVIGALVALKGPERELPIYGFENKVVSPHPPPQRAETGLTTQGRLTLGLIGGQPWLLGRTGHSLIALLDPQVARRAADLSASLLTLSQTARTEGRLPVVYKASARLAARARHLGHATRRVGWEAWLDPQTFRLTSSNRAGLRRKLRRAEAAGVTVQLAPADTAPWPALTQIADVWAHAHGGERGFSMGQFSKPYLARQRVYVAWQGDHPIAFASFHSNSVEWTLDLMRHGDSVPDGTIYALITAAIDDAARLGICQMSLAAVPEGAMGRGDLATRLMAVLAPETSHTGLLRFKSVFCPRWQPLYLIAPHHLGLALAGLSLWRAICHPPPLMPEIERDDEEYEFASAPAAWHIAMNDG